MTSLLDVNVLIALLDQNHVHHVRAWAWFEQDIGTWGWASCPLTQNGCVRVMSQPGYSGAFSANEVAERLRDACRDLKHEFWPDSISLLREDRANWGLAVGPRQITDLYLLALAVEKRGRLATFDRRVAWAAVHGAADETLRVI